MRYLFLLISSILIAPLSRGGAEDLETIPLDDAIVDARVASDSYKISRERACLWGGLAVSVAGLGVTAVIGHYSGNALYIADQCEAVYKGKTHPVNNSQLVYCQEHGSYNYKDNAGKWLGGFFGVTVTFFGVIFSGTGIIVSLCHVCLAPPPVSQL